jgi:hypothetical protein
MESPPSTKSGLSAADAEVITGSLIFLLLLIAQWVCALAVVMKVAALSFYLF